MRAGLGSADQIQEAFSFSQPVREFLARPDSAPLEHFYAGLAMQREDKRVLVSQIVGEQVQRDVARTAVNFTRHRVVIPAATWAEKAGTFENAANRLQSFERAIEPIDYVKRETQIALDLDATARGEIPSVYNAAATRPALADSHELTEFVNDVHHPTHVDPIESDMELVQL